MPKSTITQTSLTGGGTYGDATPWGVDEGHSTSILGLLFSNNPFTIVSKVPHRIIYSLNGGTFKPCIPHISKKVFKARPILRNGYAPALVIFIHRALRIEASLPHSLPGFVDLGL